MIEFLYLYKILRASAPHISEIIGEETNLVEAIPMCYEHVANSTINGEKRCVWRILLHFTLWKETKGKSEMEHKLRM